jgi:hypothetical protein
LQAETPAAYCLTMLVEAIYYAEFAPSLRGRSLLPAWEGQSPSHAGRGRIPLLGRAKPPSWEGRSPLLGGAKPPSWEGRSPLMGGARPAPWEWRSPLPGRGEAPSLGGAKPSNWEGRCPSACNRLRHFYQGLYFNITQTIKYLIALRNVHIMTG